MKEALTVNTTETTTESSPKGSPKRTPKRTLKRTPKSTPKSTLKSTLKGTRKSILEIIKSNPNITLDQVAAQLRKNPRGIDKHIKILREQGLLRRVDGNNGGHWEIIE